MQKKRLKRKNAAKENEYQIVGNKKNFIFLCNGSVGQNRQPAVKKLFFYC